MSNKALEVELMTFRVGRQLLGIHIDAIKEINCHQRVAAAPVPNPCVLGVLNLRGDVFTVLDLGRLIGLASNRTKPSDKFIVLRTTEEHLALAVDRLEDVMTVPKSDFQSLPTNFRTNCPTAYRGLIKCNRELLLVLDANNLLTVSCGDAVCN